MGKNKKSNVISVATREATLKRKVRRHLRALGFSKSENGTLQVDSDGKDLIRALQASQRAEKIKANQDFISAHAPAFLRCFASGTDINPSRIAPFLERISSGTWQSDLFRLAALTWSVPVSNGFGRRLRYLVWDEHNEKLMGSIRPPGSRLRRPRTPSVPSRRCGSGVLPLACPSLTACAPAP